MAVHTEVALQNIGYVSDLGRGEAIISEVRGTEIL